MLEKVLFWLFEDDTDIEQLLEEEAKDEEEKNIR
jgi:hypothetical protein